MGLGGRGRRYDTGGMRTRISSGDIRHGHVVDVTGIVVDKDSASSEDTSGDDEMGLARGRDYETREWAGDTGGVSACLSRLVEAFWGARCAGKKAPRMQK